MLIGTENQFVVFFRVAVLNRFYCTYFSPVLGERYIPSDIKLQFLHGLDKHSSGVLGKVRIFLLVDLRDFFFQI